MITNLRIQYFKCFLDADIKLQKLNLFVGANSSGKSSAIQALRLCIDNAGKEQGKESQMSSQDKKTGRFSELRSFLSNQKQFCIDLRTAEGLVTSTFTFGNDAMTITKVIIESNPKEIAASIGNKLLFYLPANRDSAKDAFPMDMETEGSIGSGGEYVIAYYANHSTDVLSDDIISDNNLKTMEGQVNYWLRKLTGYTLQVIPNGEAYDVKYKNAIGRELRPYHVGTGVSYITAVIIVCLSMKKDDLAIIENPEIHLHPKVQAQAMDFFNLIAQTGRQLIIETHSDHLFNGVRRLIAQKKLKNDDVSIYFFKVKESLESTPIPVVLTPKGRLTKYEKGLFDQFDDDLDALLLAE